MLEPTHSVSKDVFDPTSGEKQLTRGQQVKAVDLGDHFYVWPVPYDALSKPVSMKPWMVNQSLVPICADEYVG